MIFKVCLCAAMLLTLFGSASAQRNIGDPKVSFNFEKTNERRAIQAVFDCVGRNCTIEPGIEGKTSFTCFEAPWEESLRKMASTLGLTYRTAGAVWPIVKMEGWTGRLNLDEVSHNKITELSTPVMDVRQLLSQLFRKAGRKLSMSPDLGGFFSMHAYKEDFDPAVQRFCSEIGATLLIQDGVYKISVPKPLWLADTSSRIENVDKDQVGLIQADQTDERLLLFKLLRGAKLSFTINPDLHGPVTILLRKATFESVLQLVLRQVDGAYRIKDGIYEIFLSPHPATGS